MGNGTLIGIKIRVKNKSAQRLICLSGWCRNTLHNGIKNFLNAFTGFGRSQNCLGGVKANNILNLLLNSVRIRTWQINLVNNRNYFQIMLQGHINIGQGLGLNTLGSIHNQQGTLTGRQRTGHLIGEIHMARCINKIKAVHFPILTLVVNAYSLGLDGNATLPFQIHIVQHLIFHFTLGKGAGIFNKTVGNSRLAVVNMSYN